MDKMDNTSNKRSELHPGFEKLLEILPDTAEDFGGTEFPQPAAMAYLGKKADAESVRKQAQSFRMSSPQEMCEIAMVMAEMIEAATPGNDAYFQTDAKTRSHVFTGSKWRSGWVFLMGNSDHSELAQRFRERDFLVFAQNGASLKNAVDLGPRETAAVYFLQVTVRYAMIWGGILPGDDHEMGHFIEKDLPGVVVAHGKLTPVEELLLLALMKMGAPAVVPPDFPWDLGRHIRAQGAEQIVEAATKFPNLRIKEVQGRVIELPVFCNPANITAEFEAESTIGGGSSFFVLMPGDTGSGVELPENSDLTHCDAVGIVIEIGDKRLDISTSEYIERDALRGISTISGLRAEQSREGSLLIHCAKGARPDAAMIAEALEKWIPYEFPYLEDIHIKILTGDSAKNARPAADDFRSERQRLIAGESDDTVKYFHYCLECQPFAKDHVCIITPDRPPMCGRDRLQQKAAALFGVSRHPWKRRDWEKEEIRGSIEIRNVLNAEKGEYLELNEAFEKLSPSHVKRVQLHSLRDFPHTSCGCFGFLVFWIESLNGFGVMERDYKGEAPGGFTWDKLANAAGGKQAPGITGVSRNYLRSKRFMQGEGGLRALRWISPKAFEIVKDLLPQPDRVAVGK